jgi:tol-pal system protein YbgF
MFLFRNKNISMASLALAMLFSASATAQTGDADANSSNVVANLVIKVQELQDEVRVLHGQLEDQSIQLETLRQRQRDQFLDLDQRISGQRPSASATDMSAATGTVAGPDVRPESTDLPALGSTDEGPAVRPPMDTPSDTIPLGVPDVQSQALPANPAEEKAAYDQAFQSLKDLRYADAAESFQSFIARYPQSEYADNAQYWLGESYYVTRNYDISLDAFNDLLKNYPDSSKKPDALLKIGYAHYELKQWDQARAALEQVKQQFPDTTLARLADNRLRSMRMEGHY